MKRLIPVFFITAVFFVACSDVDTDHSGTGTLKVDLTDAPAEYEAVLVDVQGLRINVNDADTSEGDWMDLELDTVGQIDLLMFTDGNSVQLSEDEIPAGYLSQIRLILGDNNQIVVGGDTLDMDTPSAQQSGLKVNVHDSIADGETFSLMLDFDAEKSVVEKGNGLYSLKPVLTVIKE
ncbi:DUF4382 domain-containing protein [Draconibacterium sp. IB214405]|uniref:DUF4382 domain-containing protein n=1 Tax=Draconibacterium sp. IB214405 TaxID=3097352 RepID=UPI002A146DBF|nr:DUF4382 domain-containing protein [Draconibacterium sp. IB214405]MDX8339122.1 DUF4382 domain-containing protein [Draconibacterium sp. IB214405]